MKVLFVITIMTTLVTGVIDKTLAEDVVKVKIPNTNKDFVVSNPNKIPVRETLNKLGVVYNRINRQVPNIFPTDKKCYFLGLSGTKPTRKMFARCVIKKV